MTEPRPCEAYIELIDGTRVPCTLRRTGPRDWSAVPVIPVSVGELRRAHIDHLPAHASVSFAVAD